MMMTDFRCRWQNHYGGDFFRYVGNFLNVLNRSPTSQTCHQHIWSPTSVTVKIIYLSLFSDLTTKGDPWPGSTPPYMKWPAENQTWVYAKSTATLNYDVHDLTPRPKFWFMKKPERVNFLKITTIITVFIFVFSIVATTIYLHISRKRRSFRQSIQIPLHAQRSDATNQNFD